MMHRKHSKHCKNRINASKQKLVAALAGNQDFEAYMKYKFVPYDKGRFSNTLEYAYDDWTVSQFAKSLGKTEKYKEFSEQDHSGGKM